MNHTAEDLLRSGVLKLIGPLSDHELPGFYKDLDCVVHAETFAGWANVAAEALASGIPLICTAHGTRAFAIHGETALVIAEATPEEIRASITQLQSNDDLRDRLSKNGRRTMNRYSWESYATQLLGLMDMTDPSIHYSWAPELGLYGIRRPPTHHQELPRARGTLRGPFHRVHDNDRAHSGARPRHRRHG